MAVCIYNPLAESGFSPPLQSSDVKFSTPSGSLIYGYFNSTRSSRRLEKECKRNIEVMWLLEGLTPDDKTISNFRKDNEKAMKEVLKQFHVLCQELKLFSKELIVVDGSKFKANNARRKSFTKKKVKKMLEHYEKKVEEYMELLTANDKE